MGSQTIHTLCIKGKDGSRGITQLCLVEEILDTSLIMMNKDYWVIEILILTKTRDKLGTGLKTHSILKNAWNLTSLNIEISMLIKEDFVDSITRIMSDNRCKAKIDSLLYDETHFFMYNMKTTKPRQFPDLGMFHIDNFQV